MNPLTPSYRHVYCKVLSFLVSNFQVALIFPPRGALYRATTQLSFNLKWNPQWTIAAIIFLPRFLQANPAYCFHECHRELGWYWDGYLSFRPSKENFVHSAVNLPLRNGSGHLPFLRLKKERYMMTQVTQEEKGADALRRSLVCPSGCRRSERPPQAHQSCHPSKHSTTASSFGNQSQKQRQNE